MDFFSFLDYARRTLSAESSPLDYVKLFFIQQLSMIYSKVMLKKYPQLAVAIKRCDSDKTDVGRYWGEYTVNSRPFYTRWESWEYFKWMVKVYPLLDELMDFHQDRSKQVVLDYGCGPGNDIFRFLIINNAQKVIGMDVSLKAMELARQRISLYKIDPQRLELMQCSDANNTLPIESGSLDHINCAGVLHHTTNPGAILKEFYRVLKCSASGNIMVYNRDSIFYHLYIAYLTMLVRRKYQGISVGEAFSRSTDGEDCPIARSYKEDEFSIICCDAGFEVEYCGGYFDRMELYMLKHYGKKAINDEKLSQEHRQFISQLALDERGYPRFQGKYAGIGGVYKIYKK